MVIACRLRAVGAAALILFMSVWVSRGQTHRAVEMFAAGGEVASSGALTVRSTVGYPGAQTMSGSSVQVDGGFWPAVVATSEEVTARPDDPREELPSDYRLYAAYPNPFNPATTIGYALPKPDHVELAVYDPIGRRVRTLVDKRQQAGRHEVVFRAVDLPSGVYYYRLKAGSYREVRAVSLVK